MPWTIAHSYNVFLEKISLKGDHMETARARRDFVVGRLSTGFEILDSFASGSIVRGTALRSRSDLDLFVVLHHGKHVKGKTPRRLLQDVRDHLGGSARIVRKNGQAVTMYFTKWPSADIVPASRVRNDDKTINRYDIPDMVHERWLPSRPRKHDTAISSLTANHRSLVQMVKVWNSAHSSYLQSYHLEVLLLSAPVSFGDWSWALLQFFKHAKAQFAWESHDGQWVGEYLTATDRTEVDTRLDRAIELARNAWYAKCQHGDDEEAVRCCRILFGDTFPAYG